VEELINSEHGNEEAITSDLFLTGLVVLNIRGLCVASMAFSSCMTGSMEVRVLSVEGRGSMCVGCCLAGCSEVDVIAM
jgi:hypothetical protein